MKLRDMTELAVRNLREAIFRNTLTTLGVAVGVASLVAMLSLGVGLQQLASSRLTKSGLFDTVFVSPKLNLRGGPPAAAPQQPATRLLDEDARLEISRLPNVIEVFPQIRFPTEARFDGKPFPTVVAGMPLSSKLSGAFDGMKGDFFSSESADEAILQIEFAKISGAKTNLDVRRVASYPLNRTDCGRVPAAPIVNGRAGIRLLVKFRLDDDHHIAIDVDKVMQSFAVGIPRL